MKLLPQPKEIINLDGHFNINHSTMISLVDNSRVSLENAMELKKQLGLLLGYYPSITSVITTDKPNMIYLQIAEMEEEEYEIRINDNYVFINGGSQKGVFYGIQTLIQLIVNYQTELPALIIKDKPYFNNRGFYHDITRGEVPTLDTLKRIVDLISSYKINQLQLYVEHSFAFEQFHEIWSDVDPITAEEILLLDEYCQKKHVELVPSMSTFGHLYRILSTKSYAHLCELDNSDKGEFSFIKRQLHHTLDVSNPLSFEFVEKMINEFVPLFTSKQFNICADETFDLGKGKTKELAEKVGTGKLYVDFLNKIIKSVKSHNKTVMMWGDIIAKYPEYINEIPDDVIFLHWDYSYKPNENRVKIFSDVNRLFYLCPAVWSWNRLLPAHKLAHSNILNTVMYGVKYSSMGILNTNWGDFGQINFLSSSVPGMIQGAAYSWNPDCDHDLSDINQKIAQIHYHDNDGKLINLVNEISELQLFTFGELVCYIERGDKFNENISYEDIEKTNKRINESIDILFDYLHKVPQDKQIDIQEMILAAKGIVLLNKLLHVFHIFELKLDKELRVEPKLLAIEFEKWFYEYGKLWRMRNKESELHRLKDFFMMLSLKLRSY